MEHLSSLDELVRFALGQRFSDQLLDPSFIKEGCVAEKHLTAHLQALTPREIPTIDFTGITAQFSGSDLLETEKKNNPYISLRPRAEL